MHVNVDIDVAVNVNADGLLSIARREIFPKHQDVNSKVLIKEQETTALSHNPAVQAQRGRAWLGSKKLEG